MMKRDEEYDDSKNHEIAYEQILACISEGRYGGSL